MKHNTKGKPTARGSLVTFAKQEEFTKLEQAENNVAYLILDVFLF